MEIWKDIVGFEDVYQISNLGRVKSLPRQAKSKSIGVRNVKEKILSNNRDKNLHYENINLTVNGKNIVRKIHRLVAEAFIPNPNNLPLVNHINGIRYDNRLENLEWCDYVYNAKHAIQNKHGRIKNNWYKEELIQKFISFYQDDSISDSNLLEKIEEYLKS